MPRVRPVLLLEMNEVPWRLLDRAIGDFRFPAIRAFFDESATYVTLSHDKGELSPWVTWPSLHRGINNTEHGIKNLGQDVSTYRGTPLWDEYLARGLSVGVFGSMQSWPPRAPGPGGFYIPDTFAHDERCIPEFIEPLQRFNLALVRRNGRVVRDEALIRSDAVKLVPTLVRSRIRARTVARVAEQLLRERFDKTRLARRPIFQTLLFWDVFLGLYDRARPPAFSTFFSNHVAGIMHRYWADSFPEDFPERALSTPRPHAATMDFAIQVMDQILADALEVKRTNPETILVFASSMGQAAVHRDYEGFSPAIEQLKEFLAAFGVRENEFKPLLAMVPQVAVKIEDAELRTRARAEMEAARTGAGHQFLFVEEIGSSLSITISVTTRVDRDHNGFIRTTADGTRAFTSWSHAGIVMHEVEVGTGYHVPEGVLAVNGKGIAANRARPQLPATSVKAMLMELAGLETP